MPDITTRALSCGATLAIEPMQGVQSCSMQWLIPAGNAHDPENMLGRAALWSELLLRGSTTLDSRAQSDAFDRLGASRLCDAGREYLRIGATMLGERFGDALPLIADMVLSPRIDDDAASAAKALALQAIESLQDEPQQRAVLGARARHFPAPLNRSGYGETEAIAAMTADDLRSQWPAAATPVGSVIGVAGAVDPDAVADQLDDLLSAWAGDEHTVVTSGDAPRGYAHEQDDSNQVQILAVYDAPREADGNSVYERLLTSVLSGGMSSRLFSEVREKRGLCYTVSASYAAELRSGSVSAYVGTTPERAQEALDVLFEQLRLIATPEGAVQQDELARAVTGAKSKLIFSGESTSARARGLAADFIRLGRCRSLDEIAGHIDGVTLDALNTYAAGRQGVLDPARVTIQTLGPSALTPPAGG